MQRSRVDLGDVFQGPGSFTFTSDQVGNALAAFMIGKLRTFNQGAGEFKNNRNLFPALYATDSWHAAQRLTLTFGVRYEPYFRGTRSREGSSSSVWRNIKRVPSRRPFPTRPPD